jgi:hypothetical protein
MFGRKRRLEKLVDEVAIAVTESSIPIMWERGIPRVYRGEYEDKDHKEERERRFVYYFTTQEQLKKRGVDLMDPLYLDVIINDAERLSDHLGGRKAIISCPGSYLRHIDERGHGISDTSILHEKAIEFERVLNDYLEKREEEQRRINEFLKRHAYSMS